MTENISFGLLGCGRIGTRHAEQMQSFGNLTAVCDTDKVKANAFSEKYDAKPFYNIGDFLNSEKQMDPVAVCTPNGFHSMHSIEALKAGFHVICEKPLALTSVSCREMITTAEHFNRHLFVVKQDRFNPPCKR